MVCYLVMKKKLTIVTRKSALAMWQAEFVQTSLQKLDPKLQIELLGITTEGDRWLKSPLYNMGGKALFVKELEHALLDGRADLAVHSLKDLPAQLPEGLTIAAFCERDLPWDAVVSFKYNKLDEIPENSTIGTSSLRRMVQIKALRKDLKFANLRGNVQTRLGKCQQGEFDAIILAAAGLKRLNLLHHAKEILSEQQCLPAIGQGALAIECRENDGELKTLLQKLQHQPTKQAVLAERSMNNLLGGACHIPVAGYAKIVGNNLSLTGKVGDPNGDTILSVTHSGPTDEPIVLGELVAKQLIEQGADKIIASCNKD